MGIHKVVSELQRALGDKVKTGEEVASRYCHIWKMDEPLLARAVVLPKTTQEVVVVMQICTMFDQPVVVHGGLTNLVGSTETNGTEVVISLEKMNSVSEIDTVSRTVTVEAGVILESVHQTAESENLLFPLSFGAKGSAQVGGMISTNAGGLRVFRYGMTRALVLGLEVVLADGTILSSMKKIIKDNSAYDLKQMFIGSEGTLGIVTKAVLKLVENPKSRTSAFVAFDEYKSVVTFLKHMDSLMAGTLSGYELIWGETYQKMTSSPAVSKPPIPHGYRYYVLVEGLGGDYNTDLARMQSLLEQAFEDDMILDGVLAQSETDLEWFWKIREDVHAVTSQCDYDHHFDISLPIPVIGEVVDHIVKDLHEVPGVSAIYPFGHVADGNIHFIVDRVSEDTNLINSINDVVYAPIKMHGGSVSAEHGIGKHKKRYLHLCRSEEEIATMKLLKKSLDPKNLLNPGKVIDI